QGFWAEISSVHRQTGQPLDRRCDDLSPQKQPLRVVRAPSVVYLASSRQGVDAMRVAQFSEFGGPQALRLEEAAEPAPGPSDVLIKVTAVGLNFFDTLILRNQYQVTPPLPVSPGGEVAGTVHGISA